MFFYFHLRPVSGLGDVGPQPACGERERSHAAGGRLARCTSGMTPSVVFIWPQSKHFLCSQWHVYSKNRFLECLGHANWWQGAHLSPSLVVSLSLFSSVKYHIELFTDSSQPSSLTLNIAGHLTRHERREWREESQSVFSTLCATDHHSLELCLHLILT